jgi:PAS domain S-box-containing protein
LGLASLWLSLDKGNVMTNEITAAGLSEMTIIEQVGLLRSILESSTEYAIIAKDLDKTILTWNVGARRLYGYETHEAIGQNSDVLHDPADISSGKVQEIFAEVQKNGKWSGEIERVRKDGSHFIALVTITLRKNHNGVPIGYTLISRDLTELQNALHFLNILGTSSQLLYMQNMELRKATDEAQESNRLKSEFLANVSHELRTPINGIIGFAQLIYDGAVDTSSPKYKEFLADIISSANQLVMLINDVLDLAKIEAGKIVFHPEKIDLTMLFEKIKKPFQTLIKEKKIQFTMQIDPALCAITIDYKKLIQVFYNYIANALKFTPPGGQIHVRVYPETKNQFRLEVQDTGIGIHEKDLRKLFSKFHQLDTGPAKKYPGTGLGLALTKRIVEAQGGKVGVTSIYGKGSTFYAILPCNAQHKHIVAHHAADIKMPTILVVEHESRERTLIVDALTQEGYAVVTAENVVSAVEHHNESRFDVIVLDLFQTDMSKWEIIRTLRSKFTAQEAPPLVIKMMIEQPVSLGFRIHDFLLKPVKTPELLSALEWAGVIAHNNKTVLIIDSDQKALTFAKKILTEHGFHVICMTNKVSGLLALEQKQPDVVLLDPFMSGTDGLAFLHSYRQAERGPYAPLIIWTAAELTHDERKRFKHSIQRVMLKGEDVKKNILAELEQYLPPLKI